MNEWTQRFDFCSVIDAGSHARTGSQPGGDCGRSPPWWHQTTFLAAPRGEMACRLLHYEHTPIASTSRVTGSLLPVSLFAGCGAPGEDDEQQRSLAAIRCDRAAARRNPSGAGKLRGTGGKSVLDCEGRERGQAVPLPPTWSMYQQSGLLPGPSYSFSLRFVDRCKSGRPWPLRSPVRVTSTWRVQGRRWRD